MSHNLGPYVFKPIVAYTDWRKRLYITDRVGMAFYYDSDGVWHRAFADYHQITGLLEAPADAPVPPRSKLSRKTLYRLPQDQFEKLLADFDRYVKQTGKFPDF